MAHGAVDWFLGDLVMAGIDGMEMCRLLDRFRNTGAAWFPLLMITGHDTKEDMMRALEAGADDFVSKSSDISILKARIRSLLRRKLQRDEHERIRGHFRAQEDRKSVVEGQSVYVRVDLGGRFFIKKKNRVETS